MTPRPATAADRPRLRAIQSTLAEPAPGLLDAAFAAATLDLLVATDDGAPVGYALVVPGPTYAYLAELVVAPDHRGAGHGTALLAALDDPVRTVVRAGDGRARRFYERRGFRVDRRLADRFEDGDGLLLVRDGE